MFDCDPAMLDGEALAQLVADQHRVRVATECGLLELAAHWADRYSGPVDPAARRVAGEGARNPGGAGTPHVLEFAAAEFGALQDTTTNAAWELIGDALDLRHRLPRLWAAVRAGQVRVWKARNVAGATRHLNLEAARVVDEAIDGLISALSWTRFEAVLTAKIIEADPAGEEARTAAYQAQRFVRGGRTTEHGLKLLVARAAAGDVIWFLAMVDRLAEILALEGDQDLIDVRRSKAIGILARPDRALELLRRHAGHPHPQPLAADPEPKAQPASDPGAAEWRQPEAAAQWRQPEAAAEPLPAAEPETAAGAGPEPEANTEPEADPDPDPQPNPNSDPQPQPEPDPEEDDYVSVGLADGIDLDSSASRPRVDLVLHVAAEALTAGRGVVRFEGVGPVLLGQVRRWLAGTDCEISVRPVIDLQAELMPVDAYELPKRMRQLINLRSPASVFPFSSAVGPLTGRGLDADHTVPYVPPDRGGPPGQTAIANVGQLTRPEHRLKTHSGWRVRQPEPGVFVWRSPHGHHWITTPHAGTYPLGSGPLGAAIWHALTSGNTDLAA